MSKELLIRSVSPEEALWGEAYPRLVLWTAKRHSLSREIAKDVAQEAIRQLLESGEPLPDDLAGLGEKLRSRANGVVANLRRKKSTTAEESTGDEVLAERGDLGFQERTLLSADLARKVVGLLLDRVSGDPILTDIVMHMAEGTDEPGELSKLLNTDIRNIYNAKRRLAGHVAAIKKTLEEA